MSSLYYSHNIVYYSEAFSNILIFITVIKTVNIEQMLMGKSSKNNFSEETDLSLLTNCGGRTPSDLNIYRSLPKLYNIIITINSSLHA